MRFHRGALLAGAALLLASPALADDSSAALGAGGLTLVRTADIRMAKEDLYISPAKVRIRFEFANDTDHDVDSIVAFPLPDIDSGEYSERPLGAMTSDPVNFVGFSVAVDGKRVAPHVEQRAIYQGRDVTSTLAALHIPVNVITYQNDLMAHLSAAQATALETAGLGDHDSGDGERPHWIIRTKFWWSQTFPAHKTLVLEHSYQPVTGQTFYTSGDLSGGANEDGDRHWNRNYCIDAHTLKAIGARIGGKSGKPDDSTIMQAFTTDYILLSGANWKGPIGHFHLTLDKQKPDNILSLCWSGDLKKTSATTFAFTKDDYTPAQDIHLLVLKTIPKDR